MAILLLAPVALATACWAAEAASDNVIAGKALFRRIWVPSPASTGAADGLGPLFNARSCAACHPSGGPSITKAGPEGALEIAGAVVRIAGQHGEPHPWYGKQLQTQGASGLTPEAIVRIVSSDAQVHTQIRLLGPELEPGFRLSIRLAPSLRARGRIEWVAESAIRERGSQEAQRRLGLSGRARVVGLDAASPVGRYGWKASQPDLTSQIAEAFAIDLGLSSPPRPQPYGDCMSLQTACLAAPHGESRAFDGREISNAMLNMVTTYVASLELPEPSTGIPGEALLTSTGCGGCHVPRMPATGGATVETFSDLLLHDMGPHLDDGVSESGVHSNEWRTAPLLDLSPDGGSRRYLHDGRAASIMEAIGWHGGEAEPSRRAFDALNAADRQTLIRYLEAR